MKLILAVVVTFLLTGPLAIVVGYKMAEKQKFQLGVHKGRTEMLKQLYRDVDTRLDNRMSGAQQAAAEDYSGSAERLYQVEGKYINLVVVNGVRTLSVSD